MTRAMTGMLEMARRMGGDPMKGMTRMTEMMGSTGGMMGGGPGRGADAVTAASAVSPTARFARIAQEFAMGRELLLAGER